MEEEVEDEPLKRKRVIRRQAKGKKNVVKEPEVEKRYDSETEEDKEVRKAVKEVERNEEEEEIESEGESEKSEEGSVDMEAEARKKYASKDTTPPLEQQQTTPPSPSPIPHHQPSPTKSPPKDQTPPQPNSPTPSLHEPQPQSPPQTHEQPSPPPHSTQLEIELEHRKMTPSLKKLSKSSLIHHPNKQPFHQAHPSLGQMFCFLLNKNLRMYSKII